MEVFVKDDIYNSKRRYKETEGGLNAMCEIMERLTADERNKINRLTILLLKDKRYDDLERAAQDEEFQKKLMDELLSKEIDN